MEHETKDSLRKPFQLGRAPYATTQYKPPDRPHVGSEQLESESRKLIHQSKNGIELNV
jgi:hypothetical protein